MKPFKIRVAAHDAEARRHIRDAAEGALQGEEREAAEFSETHVVTRPKGQLEPDVTAAVVRQAGSFVLVDGLPASGKSALGRRIAERLRLIQRTHTLVLTREG